MTLCQFNFLENIQQLELINKHAVPVSQRTDGDFEYRLFCVDTFYIEQKWHSVLNKMLSFISFNSEEKLQPYLHAIDLWDLKYLVHKAGIRH